MNLDIVHLKKSIGGHLILDAIDYSVDFKALGIIGPSGGGKSTFLKVIAGLLIPDEGTITLGDQKIPFDDSKRLLQHRRSLGIVFQSWNLFPHLSALENIILPLYRVHGYTKPRAEEEGRKLLKRFDLLSHSDKTPHELSGGQCQRVAIIRAVARKPSLLLLDEPTSALDPLMTSEVFDLICELKEEGIAFILASHHMSFLRKIADRVAFMERGRLIESGPVEELFLRPKTLPVIDYFSKVLKY
ncbi:MAG: ATP-binding cassette domain-containing protein [Rhabdochlamydiaceae bacterium]|jgi:polar amino acid transport system ATP-binding protein